MRYKLGLRISCKGVDEVVVGVVVIDVDVGVVVVGVYVVPTVGILRFLRWTLRRPERVERTRVAAEYLLCR